jgi:hypothetical protein
MRKLNVQFYTVRIYHSIIWDPDQFPDPDPLRQNVPDPTGAGSTTLVFKTVVSTIKLAPTGTFNPDGVLDCFSYLWKL